MTSAETYLLVANVACAIGTFVVGLIFIMTPIRWAQLVARCSYLLILPVYGLSLYRMWSWQSIELPEESEVKVEKDAPSSWLESVKATYRHARYLIAEQPDEPTHPFYCFLNLVSLLTVEFMMFQYARETYSVIWSALQTGNTEGLAQQGILGSVCAVAYLAAILAYEYEIVQLYKQKTETEIARVEV